MRRRRSFLVSLLVALTVLPSLALARQYTEQEEEKIGREGVTELEKEFKVIDDPKQLKRIDAMVKALTPVTERPKVIYKVKILDTKDVNALSLPGGYIYFTKGLVESAESDDELAGVLAHEMAHNAHKHSLTQLDKSTRMDQQVMLAVLASIVLGQDTVDPGKVMVLGQILKMNAESGYGQKAEAQADHSAVEYLVAAKQYNPNGLLQFMQGLQRQEGRGPQEPLGIFRTHPPTPTRVAAIEAQLGKHGIPIVRIPGKNTPVAEARAATVNGSEIAEVVLRDRVVFQPAADREGKKPLERAKEAAQRVSEVFREYPADRFVRVEIVGEEQVVCYRDAPLLRVTPADARFHNTTPEALADRAARALRAVIWNDFVNRAY